MQRKKYQCMGYDVYCPDLIHGNVFEYEEADDAYLYYYENVESDACHLIWNLIDKLRCKYEKVYIVGYSVGATLAWRCSENPNCAGVVACYGSRIRDYLQVVPKCPVLLIFAEQDSFAVNIVMKSLESSVNTKIELFSAEHGFIDSYSTHYDLIQAENAEKVIKSFLSEG